MTIVYREGGEIFLGSHSDQNLKYWKWYGGIKNTRYMYKGYRYFEGKKETVIVFDNKLWDISEYQKRKTNGFINIKKYICFHSQKPFIYG